MSERDDILEQLSAYLDGELKPVEARDLEAKLQSDPALAEELERLRRVTALVRGLPREGAGADFAARVIAQAERTTLVGKNRHEREKGALAWVRYAAVAALVLIFLGVGGIIIKTLNTPDFNDRVASKTTEPVGGVELARDMRKSDDEKRDRLKEADQARREPKATLAKGEPEKAADLERGYASKSLGKGGAAFAEKPAPVAAKGIREESAKDRFAKVAEGGVEVAVAPPPSPVHAKTGRPMGKNKGDADETARSFGGRAEDKAGKLGKDQPVIAESAEEVDVVGEEVIWTDNVTVAAGDVEKLLSRNGIALAANDRGVLNVSHVSGQSGEALQQEKVPETLSPQVARQAQPTAQRINQAPQVAAAPSTPPVLSKDGGGTQTLGAANAYSGTTTVAGGTLDVSQQQNLSGRNRVNLPQGQGFNSYVCNNISPSQVQYYVYVPTSQVSRLQNEFNSLRNSTRYNRIAANTTQSQANSQLAYQGQSGNLGVQNSDAKQGGGWTLAAQAAAPAEPTAAGTAQNTQLVRRAPASSQAVSLPVQSQRLAVQPAATSGGGQSLSDFAAVQQKKAEANQTQQSRVQRESLQALVITVNGLPAAHANQAAPAATVPAKANTADAVRSDSSRPASK